MMKKHTYYSRIIALVMSLLFIVLLGGCGGSKEANNIKKPPKEAKIELDMEVFGLSSITINDVPETLEIKKLAITKRLTESGYDEAYVSAELKNDHYSVIADYALTYRFYDVGGWCLENGYITNCVVTPLKPFITDNQFVEAMCSVFSNCTVVDSDFGVLENGNHCSTVSFEATLDYPYFTKRVSGQYVFEFYNNLWNEALFINEVEDDWSKALGSWRYEEGKDYIDLEIVSIETISDNKALVSYNYSTSSWNDRCSSTIDGFSEEIKAEEVDMYSEYCDVFGNQLPVPKSVKLYAFLGLDKNYANYGQQSWWNFEDLSVNSTEGVRIHYWDYSDIYDSVATLYKK